MPDEPFDWERDDDRRAAPRGDDHWYRQADNTPLLAGQFWALWDRHMYDFRQLKEEVQRNEQRLLEERGKDLALDMVRTTFGRFFLILIGVVSAFLIARFGFNPLRIVTDWWGG